VNMVPPYKSESGSMRFFRRLGFERLAWSLRRLHCPVGREALVLEVGSGGNPYARANVLLDAYEVTQERHWVPLLVDRPTVLGFVERLPFRDKAFDFVIASHVLEHSYNPAGFLEELQRVARGGYIEVPDAFMERINPYHDHRLEITVRHGRLQIRKKAAWRSDPDLVELYEDRVKRIMTRHVIPQHPFAFHVRHYWRDKIEYEIVNPETKPPLEATADRPGPTQEPHVRSRVNAALGGLVRHLFSQRHRNSRINLMTLLRCTDCHRSELRLDKEELSCQPCGRRYPIRHRVPDMTGFQERGTGGER
jgi:SAM-dependent methyltransferase